MAGYTKGRWVVGVGPVTGQLCVQTEHVAGGAWICGQLHNPDASMPREEAEANAHLIAAAPDLLEAGKDCADFLDIMLNCWVTGKEISDEEGRRATAAVMALNAAITRATPKDSADA